MRKYVCRAKTATRCVSGCSRPDRSDDSEWLMLILNSVKVDMRRRQATRSLSQSGGRCYGSRCVVVWHRVSVVDRFDCEVADAVLFERCRLMVSLVSVSCVGRLVGSR